jgi:uncharacterized repeat protein (TIGR01451 family)
MKTPIAAAALPRSPVRPPKGKAPGPPGRARSKIISLKFAARAGAFFALIALFAAAAIFPAYTASSASRARAQASRADAPTKAAPFDSARPNNSARAGAAAPFALAPAPMPFFARETLATYDGTCATPKTVFSLGETVCVKASGFPNVFTVTGLASHRFSWVNVGGYVLQRVDISSDPASATFALPSARTTTIDGEVIDNRGRWAVRTENTADASVSNLVYFDVRDPANAAVDLSVTNVPKIERVSAGANAIFTQYVVNKGPDSANGVTLTADVPAGTTFVSAAQTSGPAFNCTTPPATPSVVCTAAAALAKDTPASFQFTFQVASTAPNDTPIASTATVASAASQTETHPEDNSVEADATVFTSPCSITPADASITVDNEPGQGGAHVSYPAPTVAGNCGEIECSPASGSFFPLGQTAVICTGLDTGTQGTIAVTVNDTQTPVITCPNDMSVPEHPAGSGSTVVNFPAPTVIDNDPNVRVTFDPPSGSTFTLGETTVTATATDVSGNSASCTFKVTVHSLNCSLDCPEDITVIESSPGSGEATVTFGQPTAAGPDCGTTVTYDHASGSSFPVGTTIVTATDETSGATCSFKVIVRDSNDTEPPTITCPANIETAAPANSCSANVSVGTPTAADDRPGVTVSGQRSDGAAISAPYPVGETVITWTATDAAGNDASCEQSVKVTENIPPSVTPPAPRSVFVNASCDTVEVPNFTVGLVASDNCTPANFLEVTQSPAVETLVGVGSHPVTITVKDASGNSTTVTTTFNVIDNTPPAISCPADIVVDLPLNSTATSVAVSFSASASDNCGAANVTYDHAPGSAFPVGTTVVTATATDASGNQASCSFNVTVHYVFTGFFSPVDNPPVVNQVKAGQNVPLKFSLSGNKGLEILFPGFPSSQQVNCATNAPINDLAETDTPGSSTLTYDASSDRYQYNWKTEKAWVGTCRLLVVKLSDGTSHTANFKFK